jgi:hypothetical protein
LESVIYVNSTGRPDALKEIWITNG